MREEEILDLNKSGIENFLTYRKFYSQEDADTTISVFKQFDIPCILENNTPDVSDYIMGQGVTANFSLKIRSSDFTKATGVLSKMADLDIEQVDKDYYLFEFSNDELLEVLMEGDSWNAFDKQLSKKILNERGVTITEDLLRMFADKRIKELAKKEHHSPVWTVVGYLSAFFGGIIGIAIGINLWTAKKTLPDGRRVYAYTDKDRNHGQIITAIGVIMFVYVAYLVATGQWFY